MRHPASYQAPDPEVLARLARLRRALSNAKSAWGGCPLEPDVLLLLAQSPPADAAALADVPGVGPALSARLGGAILGALASAPTKRESPVSGPVLNSLVDWRAGVAKEMGVAAYVVLPDSALRHIAEFRPADRQELARVKGVGPRTLAKFGDDLLRLSRTAG